MLKCLKFINFMVRFIFATVAYTIKASYFHSLSRILECVVLFTSIGQSLLYFSSPDNISINNNLCDKETFVAIVELVFTY